MTDTNISKEQLLGWCLAAMSDRGIDAERRSKLSVKIGLMTTMAWQNGWQTAVVALAHHFGLKDALNAEDWPYQRGIFDNNDHIERRQVTDLKDWTNKEAEKHAAEIKHHLKHHTYTLCEPSGKSCWGDDELLPHVEPPFDVSLKVSESSNIKCPEAGEKLANLLDAVKADYPPTHTTKPLTPSPTVTAESAQDYIAHQEQPEKSQAHVEWKSTEEDTEIKLGEGEVSYYITIPNDNKEILAAIAEIKELINAKECKAKHENKLLEIATKTLKALNDTKQQPHGLPSKGIAQLLEALAQVKEEK
ncbi:MAG: hypothetical protein GY861_01270 [bacterium]|nr:hypothetical protein [bacterium]